mmetsp:Transcript_1431/g.2396  ORF Transcript_1431/g.2396 Transcript_1431/m.2396 type:complete len:576 (+) Transcript_1431:365-2092(+)|eukprot:CAMPEP_0184701418 /NCGR_PEP_ID=MMETSP0313-20130426/19818_1 /TAXON_ID=2792 /ORGANISM="Porphyridium aerugineum, Strain SAG 1380-2" /LENGTH=575 /DNA_ID=CAMNT_0027161475 /DNA_START=263 /DNA_END=1990 /DNA_ORIENTATION=-
MTDYSKNPEQNAYELSVGVFNLPLPALGGSIDSFATVFSRLDAVSDFKEIGKTEVSINDTDPNFVKKFWFPWENSDRLEIRVKFYGLVSSVGTSAVVNIVNSPENQQLQVNTVGGNAGGGNILGTPSTSVSANSPAASLTNNPILMRKAEFVGQVTLYLSELYERKDFCLDIPLENENGVFVNNGETVAFLSTELISRKVRDAVTCKFVFDDYVDFGGTDGKAMTYFVISRELKHSPGQWARIHRSNMLDPPNKTKDSKFSSLFHKEAPKNDDDIWLETEPCKLTSDTFYANDPNRRILIEMYHYRPKKGASSQPKKFGRLSSLHMSRDGSANTAGSEAPAVSPEYHTLAGSASMVPSSLERILKDKVPLRFEVDNHDNLKKGEMGYHPLSFFSLKPNTPKMIIFRVERLSWFMTEKEKEQHWTTFESYIERDMWARLIVATQAGVTMEKQWHGSSYRGFFNKSAQPMGGGLAKPSQKTLAAAKAASAAAAVVAVADAALDPPASAAPAEVPVTAPVEHESEPNRPRLQEARDKPESLPNLMEGFVDDDDDEEEDEAAKQEGEENASKPKAAEAV